MILIISSISLIVFAILSISFRGSSIGRLFAVLALAAVVMCWVSVGVGRSIQNDQQQPKYVSSSERISLVALGTNETDDGGYWFLGSGAVDNKPIYTYLTIDDEGFITQEWEYTRDSRVNEDGGDSPYVETVHYLRPGNIWLPWSNPTGYTVDFHVPVGSVQGGFYNVELGTDSN
jgi:hypothetical protein